MKGDTWYRWVHISHDAQWRFCLIYGKKKIFTNNCVSLRSRNLRLWNRQNSSENCLFHRESPIQPIYSGVWHTTGAFSRIITVIGFLPKTFIYKSYKTTKSPAARFGRIGFSRLYGTFYINCVISQSIKNRTPSTPFILCEV